MLIADSPFFVSGGTLEADAPSYVVRSADSALLDALLCGEFCYVLDTRQVGKSSLMVRTATALRQRGQRVAVLDLTGYGQNLSVEQWYYSLLVDLADQIDMMEELSDLWRRQRDLGPLPRLLSALRHAALAGSATPLAGSATPLAGSATPLVLFIDEIDAVRSLPFSADELFAGIRECYNRRTQDAAYGQLTFCLLGVATPAELISDARATPFNIGRRIELSDFTAAEARPLAAGLLNSQRRHAWRSPSATALHLMDRVIYWTGGHPYLTQLCCQALADQPQITTVRGVDRLCLSLFCSHSAQRTDNNLAFVGNRLQQSGGDRAALLDLYRRILAGRDVVLNAEQSANAAILCLAGIVRLENGVLRPRNRIYQRVFNRTWIRTNMPDAELRRQRIAYQRGFCRAAAAAATLILAMGMLIWSARHEANRAEQARRIMRDLLYAADIRAGQQALMEYNPDALRQLMREHRHEPWSYEWRYLWRESDRSQRTFRGHHSVLLAIAYAPDGRQLATADGDKTIHLWQVSTGALLRTIHGRAHGILALAYSPDGRWLASCGDDDTLILWDSTTGSMIYRRPVPDGIYTLSFSPDSRLLALGENGRFQVLDARQGKVRWTGRLQTNAQVLTLAFSPDGKQLFTPFTCRTMRVWETATGRPLAVLKGRPPYTRNSETGNFYSLACSPDGKRVAATYLNSSDAKVHLWDVASRREINPLTDEATPGRIAFSPDGRQLAAANDNNTVNLWSLATGMRQPPLIGHSDNVTALAYSPDGRWLATASWDQTAKLWSTQGERQVVLRGIDSYAACAFSPDSRHLATIFQHKSVRLYDIGEGREVAHIRMPVAGSDAIAYSPDGGRLAVSGGAKHNSVDLCDVATGKWTRIMVLPPSKRGDHITALCFAPHGKWLAIGRARGSTLVWDLVRSRIHCQFNAGPEMEYNWITALAFSTDSNLLVIGGNRGAISQWDMRTKREQIGYRGHAKGITALAFAPDNRTLASGSEDGTVSAWNVATRRETLHFSGHSGYVSALHFAYHGNVLQACLNKGLNAGEIREWRAADAAEIPAAQELIGR
jgi:WD40 repeat protein